MICARCHMEVEYIPQWGQWAHKNGGIIMQYCETCRRSMTFERPLKLCPKCKSELKDSHIATPIRERT